MNAEANFTDEWLDETRDRPVPVRLRLPNTMQPVPVVILSHGLGGSRDGLAYLGEGLVKAGFAVLHLQHQGSDIAIWRGQHNARLAFAAALLDVRNALNRLGDIVFALDELARRRDIDTRLQGRLDLTRIAAAGHSYGAWAVSHVLGERLPGEFGLLLPDPRLMAGIEMSPIPLMGMPPAAALQPVRVPILHLTGTGDRGMEGTTPEMRVMNYHSASAPGILVILNGATHASFAGEAAAGEYWNQPRFHARIADMCRLFLRGILLDDARALSRALSGAPLYQGDHIESKGFENHHRA